jgi:hypothetical protein
MDFSAWSFADVNIHSPRIVRLTYCYFHRTGNHVAAMTLKGEEELLPIIVGWFLRHGRHAELQLSSPRGSIISYISRSCDDEYPQLSDNTV